MATVFLALGSNLDDRAANLRRALELLRASVEIKEASDVYESEPMYVSDQPLFYNMVVSGATDLPPHELLKSAKGIEAALGRRAAGHNLPRPIDIDILMYDSAIVDTPELTIPHPRMLERAFVMLPLSDIAPTHVHPVARKPLIDLWDEIGERVSTVWAAEEQL